MQAIDFAVCYDSWCHGNSFLSPTGTWVLSQFLCRLLHKYSRTEMTKAESSVVYYTLKLSEAVSSTVLDVQCSRWDELLASSVGMR